MKKSEIVRSLFVTKYMNHGGFGETFRAIRNYLGFALTEVADAAGIKKGYLSGIETGTMAPPTEQVMAKLHSALSLKAAVSLEEFQAMAIVEKIKSRKLKTLFRIMLAGHLNRNK